RAMLRAELDSNPVLEEAPTRAEAAAPEPVIDKHAGEPESHEEMNFRKEFDVLAKLDDEWRDYFFSEREARPFTIEDAERRNFIFDSASQGESLQEHLLGQFGMFELSQADLQAGELLVGSINEDGYLTTPVEELAQSTGINTQHLEELLKIVMKFDPPGIGARDLRECLLLQLDRLGKSDGLPARIVQNHLDQLAAHKFHEIARALQSSVAAVQSAAAFISTLTPKPGQAYNTNTSPYITPEVVVHKDGSNYVVILNDDDLPHLRISKHYRQLMNDATTPANVKQYIAEKVRSSAFLIRSLHVRQHTIYRIANEIVREQQAFFEHGVSQLRPLTMAQVATIVGLHETTISRAVAGKHMQTPAGIFEMKYFFTPGLTTGDGQSISNKAVQDAIAALVAAEDSSSPVSDQTIQKELAKQGITVARRTITKYRLILKIPSSRLRKRY
ncbi:MAG: RNA polymerase factor sigma-54, partial [bacterium]